MTSSALVTAIGKIKSPRESRELVHLSAFVVTSALLVARACSRGYCENEQNVLSKAMSLLKLEFPQQEVQSVGNLHHKTDKAVLIVVLDG
ncbi:hypothetical protein HI914_05870 [Erysiphe necator]|nr:hypothetical protein HI914_05870 [Erysiphe necator]